MDSNQQANFKSGKPDIKKLTLFGLIVVFIAGVAVAVYYKNSSNTTTSNLDAPVECQEYSDLALAVENNLLYNK